MEQHKILLVGNTHRGKTKFLKYNILEELYDTPCSTLGVEVYPLDFKFANLNMTFNVWDTAGDERYKGLDDGYYINSKGAILFYSTNKEKNLYIKKLKAVDPNMKIVLVYTHTSDKIYKKDNNIKMSDKYKNCIINMNYAEFMDLPFILMASELYPQKKEEILNNINVKRYNEIYNN